MIVYFLLEIALVYTSFYWFLLRSWVGEDAFIFFRYVDNFLNGYGLVFNVGERVEGFTSPLWVFVLSLLKFVLKVELRPLSIILGLVLSTTAIAVLLYSRSMRNKLFFPVGVLLLVTTSAFRDFATSGFETSLTYLLVALVIARILKSGLFTKPWLLSLLLALLVLNRPESVLIWIYVLICHAVRIFGVDNKKQALKETWSYLVVGLVLLGGYQIFRMGYFASFFPNTFYAKKGGEFYFRQGLFYLVDFIKSYRYTMVILFTLFFAFIFGAFAKVIDKQRIAKYSHLLMMGILIVGYVFYAGGDYMHGRFLLIPFMFFAAALGDAAETVIGNYAEKYRVSTLILTLALLPPLYGMGYFLYLQKPYSVRMEKQVNGIKDERAHFNYIFKPEEFKAYISEPVTNEFNWARRGFYYKDVAQKLNRPVSVVMPNIGFFGYAADDKVNVMGGILTDPYFAKYPIETRGTIGHENESHYEYTLSRKPQFAYTPFKLWNEAMHAKYSGSPNSEIITGDHNDSFIPVFDLSDNDFVREYTKITGVDFKVNIDTKIADFLKNGIKTDALEKPYEIAEFMGFLKLHWYPYTTAENRMLFDSARQEYFKNRVLSSYEIFESYLKPESDDLWSRITKPLTFDKFIDNIVYAVKTEFSQTNRLPAFIAVENPKKLEFGGNVPDKDRYIMQIEYKYEGKPVNVKVSLVSAGSVPQTILSVGEKEGPIISPRHSFYLNISDVVVSGAELLFEIDDIKEYKVSVF